jgi:hypothetical protein
MSQQKEKYTDNSKAITTLKKACGTILNESDEVCALPLQEEPKGWM